MRFDDVLVPASFVHRDNRFRVTVEPDSQLTAAHLPNSGRLGELLTLGRRVWLRPASGPARRTRYDLLIVEHAGTMVSVDARLPNPLLHEALLVGRLPPFAGYRTIRRDVCLGESRLDFLLEDEVRRCWIRDQIGHPGGERSGPLPRCADGARPSSSSCIAGCRCRRSHRQSPRRRSRYHCRRWNQPH